MRPAAATKQTRDAERIREAKRGGEVARGRARPASEPGRRRRFVRHLAAVAALAIVTLAAAALLAGPHSHRRSGFAVAAVTVSGHERDRLHVRESTVVDVDGSARAYGTADADIQNGFVNTKGQPVSEDTPLPRSAFRRPIAAYRVYAERWAARFQQAVAGLRLRLAGGDRRAAQAAWESAYADFMHLGADYNLLPSELTNEIAEVPARTDARRFPGLHWIAKGLWGGARLSSLVPAATQLARAATRLRAILPTVQIGILAYTLRAHEVLEDAQRDLIGGGDVIWSGAGVLGTAAGVAATRELLRTLTPLLEGRGDALATSEFWLAQLQTELSDVDRADHGWPQLRQLTISQRERIDGLLAGCLEALAQVPGELETVSITAFPPISKSTRGAR